jgi:hypothetical protein
MKKILIIALIIGIILGIFQTKVVREDTKTVQTPVYAWQQCGAAELCFPDDSPPVSYRDEQVTYNERQGFPIAKPGIHELDFLDSENLPYLTPLISNFFIFVLSVPLITFLGYRLLYRKSKK